MLGSVRMKFYSFLPNLYVRTLCVRFPCLGTDMVGVTLQTRDTGFQVIIASQDHVLVFLYEIFLYPLGADMVSALCPTPKLWGFPHCLWSPMSVPGSCNCAGILVTKLGHHQNPSPVASSASTHKKFCSFSLHLSLKVFNTIFLQFLPPEIITRYYPDFDKSC